MTLSVLVLGLMTTVTQAASSTASIYSDVEKSVYQVRVINKQTGKRVTIGSGFVAGSANLLATNYHVVSSYVGDPDNYQLDYLSNEGRSSPLTLVDLDVVHDLALLKADTPLGTPLSLGKVPPKGATLYSLGNPLDLGFSIIPGTNNGMLTNSADHNILFSGSLNPGMSGGPTLNDQGEVIGINVATSGNQISFLVASEYLALLLERSRLRDYKPIEDITQHVAQQLADSMRSYMLDILKQKDTNSWETNSIGHMTVPTEISPTIHCWDASEDSDKESFVTNYFTQCSNERSIYLTEGLEIGRFQYQYDWYEADKIWPAHFYRLYESKNGIELLNGKLGLNAVTPFKCFTHFTAVTEKPIKLSVCRRDYKAYAGLSDVVINGVLVSEKNQGFIFNIDAIGTDFDAVMQVFEKMLGMVTWKN